MTSHAKMKDTMDGSANGDSCHDKNNIDVAGTSSDAPGFRRSSRRRCPTRVFEPQQRRKSYNYWSATDKVALLRFLNRLNNREILHAGHNHRFPYSLIRRHVKSKSMEDIRMLLSKLERRGAAAALMRMKKQSPLESWCQMADNLTVLTGDDSSRHLIRVCRVMALESIDDDDNNSEKMLKVTHKNIEASMAPPDSASASTSADVSASTSADVSASTPADPSAAQSSIPTSERTLPASSSQPQDLGPDTVTKEMTSERTTGKAKRKSGRRANRKDGKVQNEEEILHEPDYESIYKYIGGLMQGEQNEIGGLESLIVLDCLKSIDVHLKERNNSEQKHFVQQRFVDLLRNMYLSVDSDIKGSDGDNAVGDQLNITTEDLMSPGSSQSQARSDKPVQSEKGSLDSDTAAAVNQSKGPVISDGQSASDSRQASQSQPAAQQTLPSETANPKADTRQFKAIGLGSLNPFNIPVKLLEIRKDW